MFTHKYTEKNDLFLDDLQFLIYINLKRGGPRSCHGPCLVHEVFNKLLTVSEP